MTNQHKSRLFRLSVVANVLMFVMLCGIGYYKRASFVRLYDKHFAKSQVNEQELKAFNTVKYDGVSNYYTVERGGQLKVLFLGNSLTYCGVAAEEPDKTRRGLTSTAPEKDYVHLVVKRLAEDNNASISYSALNIADFERTFSTIPFDYSQLEKLDVRQPDILIVQIGENVSGDDIKSSGDAFEKAYIELLNCFPNAKKIICIPFWPDWRKAEHITNVALATKSHLVDLSHLGGSVVAPHFPDAFDGRNLAQSYRKYKNPGVGIHPGDYGFSQIADAVYAAVVAE